MTCPLCASELNFTLNLLPQGRVARKYFFQIIPLTGSVLLLVYGLNITLKSRFYNGLRKGKNSHLSLRNNLWQSMISCIFALLFPLYLTLVTGCKERPVIKVVEFPQTFADLVDTVQPAVVNISTTTTVRVPAPDQNSGRFSCSSR